MNSKSNPNPLAFAIATAILMVGITHSSYAQMITMDAVPSTKPMPPLKGAIVWWQVPDAKECAVNGKWWPARHELDGSVACVLEDKDILTLMRSPPPGDRNHKGPPYLHCRDSGGSPEFCQQRGPHDPSGSAK